MVASLPSARAAKFQPITKSPAGGNRRGLERFGFGGRAGFSRRYSWRTFLSIRLVRSVDSSVNYWGIVNRKN